ncbi:MAG: hypothetical protein U1F77_08095 [Kiritimatiellia bacterium]
MTRVSGRQNRDTASTPKHGDTLVPTPVKAGKAPKPRALLFEITPDKEIVWQMPDSAGSTGLSSVKLPGP